MRQLIGLIAAAVLLFMGAVPVAAHGHGHGRFMHGSYRTSGGAPRRTSSGAPSRTFAVCASQFIPYGWGLVDTQTNPACGGGTLNNVWTLMDLREAAPGQVATLCQGPVPYGWAVTGYFTDPTRCAGDLAGAFDNLMTVTKL